MLREQPWELLLWVASKVDVAVWRMARLGCHLAAGLLEWAETIVNYFSVDSNITIIIIIIIIIITFIITTIIIVVLIIIIIIIIIIIFCLFCFAPASTRLAG